MAVADVNLHQPLILNECGNILPTPMLPCGAKRFGINRGVRRVGAGCGSSLIGDAAYGDDLIYTGTGLGDVGYNISSWYDLPVDCVSGTAGLTDANLAAINSRIVRRRVLHGGAPCTKNIGVRYLRPRLGCLGIQGVPALPLPPQSIVVGRLPPVPPRPQTVILEKWLPHRLQAGRRILVQRAPLPLPYPCPRNVVIQYEPVPARVNQRVQFLGVVPGDPQAYVQKYGGSLLNAHSLEQMARAVGVVENISPSVLPGSIAANSRQFASPIGALENDTGAVEDDDASL